MIIIVFSYRKVNKELLFKVADYLLFVYPANQRSIMLSNLYAIKGDKSMTNKHFNRYKSGVRQRDLLSHLHFYIIDFVQQIFYGIIDCYM